MRTSALIYRPPSKRPIAIAFAAAIMIHLCAVALASRRASPMAETLATSDGPIVELEEPVAPQMPPELETIPVPPSSSVPTDFVEPDVQPLHSTNHNPKPIRPIAKPRSGEISNGHALALSAPRPEYPYEARRRNITGSGVVTLTIDPTNGAVVDAEMEQSIGNSILDQAALSAFRRWRFKTGTPSRVRVPITFTITGAQF
jgi:TonB family protein